MDDFLGELVGCFLGEDLGLGRAYSGIENIRNESFATSEFERDCSQPTREVHAHLRFFDQMFIYLVLNKKGKATCCGRLMQTEIDPVSL